MEKTIPNLDWRVVVAFGAVVLALKLSPEAAERVLTVAAQSYASHMTSAISY